MVELARPLPPEFGRTPGGVAATRGLGEAGKRFSGLLRFATPLLRLQGLSLEP